MLGFILENTKPLNILCIGAHCDDIEIGAGGTLLKLFDKYEIKAVKWLVFTSNESRKKEAIVSANEFLKSVKVSDIDIRSYRDGFLPFIASEIKDCFENIKDNFQPDIIFTHYRDDRHQDHRLICDLTWNTWRNHLILEYEIPKYDGDMGIPNFYVSLNPDYIEKKNHIITSSFISQQHKHWFDSDTFKALPRLRGIESATVFAEAFYVRKVCFCGEN